MWLSSSVERPVDQLTAEIIAVGRTWKACHAADDIFTFPLHSESQTETCGVGEPGLKSFEPRNGIFTAQEAVV